MDKLTNITTCYGGKEFIRALAYYHYYVLDARGMTIIVMDEHCIVASGTDYMHQSNKNIPLVIISKKTRDVVMFDLIKCRRAYEECPINITGFGCKMYVDNRDLMVTFP